MDLECLSGPKVIHNGPKEVPNGPSIPKLRLPKVTMELDKSLNQSPQGGLEKIGYMSRDGPPGNCYKVPNKYLIGHVLRGQNEVSTD